MKEIDTSDNQEPSKSSTDLDQLIALYSILKSDVTLAFLAYGESRSDAHARMYIRGAFACIEGLTFRLKQQALALSEEKGRTLSAEEVAGLRERTGAVDENGKTSSKQLNISTYANFQLLVNVAAPCFGVTMPEACRSPVTRKRFKASVAIRNRLMHPKTLEDLQVSKEELIEVIDTFKLVDTVFDYIVKCEHQALRGQFKNFLGTSYGAGSLEADEILKTIIADDLKQIESYSAFRVYKETT